MCKALSICACDRDEEISGAGVAVFGGIGEVGTFGGLVREVDGWEARDCVLDGVVELGVTGSLVEVVLLYVPLLIRSTTFGGRLEEVVEGVGETEG
jgi:hypothetical protein